MALSVRRSILVDFHLISGLLFFCILGAPAWAQHPMPRVPPPAPTPPMIHTPVYRPPVYQTPMYRPPVYPQASAPSLFTVPALRAPITVPFRPPLPFRPAAPYRIYVLPVFTQPFWTYSFCWWAICDRYWTTNLIYNTVPLDQWNPTNSIPPMPTAEPYIYGVAREDTPELILKDGTVLNVTDYWVVDNQLHFKMMEAGAAKPTEQVIPFEELELQQTIDADTRLGFRFILRNEPFEQYVRDHPDGPPPALTPQH